MQRSVMLRGLVHESDCSLASGTQHCNAWSLTSTVLVWSWHGGLETGATVIDVAALCVTYINCGGMYTVAWAVAVSWSCGWMYFLAFRTSLDLFVHSAMKILKFCQYSYQRFTVSIL
jgi:hypothetical protein